MGIEHYTVNTRRYVAPSEVEDKGFGGGSLGEYDAKEADEFGAEVAEIYRKVAENGGRVLSHVMVDLIENGAEDKSAPSVRTAVPHAVIIVDTEPAPGGWGM